MSVEPSELESSFRFVEKGQVTATIAAEATFYFIDFDAAKPGLIAAYERVMAVLRLHVKLYATENMKRPTKLAPSVDSLFAKWFAAKAPSQDMCALTVQSGDAAEAVGPWGLEFAVDPSALAPKPSPFCPEPVAEAGFFHFSLPVHSLFAEGSPFRELVVEVARLLPFRSGHAGYGIQYADGYPRPMRDRQIYARARRFKGLDCRNLSTTSLAMYSHIKGVNWLTMLDHDFSKRLGGDAALASALGDGFPIERGPHGLVIQAGPRPLLGDVNRMEDMTPYVEVNELTRSLRIQELLPLPGFSRSTTAEWLRRSDRTA